MKVKVDQLYEIKPRSIVYLFSGGKDSSLALLKTRDVVKMYADENRARVYMVHITVTGNTHPLNVYASATVMYWHKKHYGFEPVFLAQNKVFQEYVAKYGLQIGSQRWCYTEFKNKVISGFERKLPRPVVEIDGMKPSDSKHRSMMLNSEWQFIERRHNGFRYWAWHPLFSFEDDPLEELKKHPEFQPVVLLYELYGDSLNCVICPYKSKQKYIRYHQVENLSIVYDYMKLVMRSRRHINKLSFSKNKTLEVISREG